MLGWRYWGVYCADQKARICCAHGSSKKTFPFCEKKSKILEIFENFEILGYLVNR